MKRLIASALIVLSFVFVLAGTVLATASDRWSVSMSTPANTTSKSFNVQYTTLSVESGDDITVKLFQNGAFVDSQTTTKAFGDSGAFAVTVPSTGNYSYFIEAMNSTDEVPKTTGTVSVVVSDAPQAASTSINTSTTSTTGGRGSGAPADIDGDGQIDDANGDGVIDDPVKREEHAKKLAAAAAAAAAVKAARDDNGNGVPDEDEQDDESEQESDSSSNGWLIAGGVVVLAGAGGYYLYSRRPKA